MPRPATPPSRGATPEQNELRSTTDIGVQRLLPLIDLLVLQLLVAAGTVAAPILHFPGWQGAIAGLVVALILVVRFRGTTLPRLVALRTGFWLQRRKRARKTAPAEPFDVPMADGTLIGFRWDGNTLMSLLQIEENPQAMTIMEPGTTVSGETVPVQALIDCLQQFDITLDSIDVISQGARSQGHSQVAAVYDAVLGPLPAIAQRNVWIVIRLDPSRCAAAVRRRGGGRDGIMRAATTATRRVSNRLTEGGLRTKVLTASEIGQATNQLTDGVDLTTVEETWRTCREGRFRLRSFAIKPRMLTTAGLGLLWTIPSYSTTMSLSLRRDHPRGPIQVRGLARFDTHGRARIGLRGLTHLRGHQYSALAASLPVPPPPRQVEKWSYSSVSTTGADSDDFAHLQVPASGCGQVVGADDHGRAVALSLFGPQVRRVEIAGTLHLAQQVVLRSLALGAHVLVHSRRPTKWRTMVDEVEDQDLLWVSDFNRGSMQAGADRNYSVEMFDGVAEQSVRVGVTAIIVVPPNSAVTASADVALESLNIDADTVRVSTATGSTVITMVATDDEMRYLKASFAASGRSDESGD